jgi:hypothetical protein
MVHRDIKPSNLMLTRDGGRAVVKVLDFGLAKSPGGPAAGPGLTAEGSMLGTPDYVAPEQTLDAAGADTRADVYSLGCTLYHLLAGRPPFSGKTVYDVLRAHHSATAARLNELRPDVPDGLAGVVATMMAKDPGDRFPTPAAVAAALAPFCGAGAASPPPAAGRKPRGRLVAAATAVLVVAVGIALAAGAFRVKTKEGTIVLMDLPADAEVLVDGERVTVTRKGDEATVTVNRSGPHGLTVRQGGREVHSSDVTVHVGGEPVRVRLEKPVAAAPAPVTPPAGPKKGLYPLPAGFTKPVRGPWEVKGGELVQPMGTWGSQIAFGDPAWTDYDFTVEAMRTSEHVEPFGLIVRAPGYFNTSCVFVLGGFLGDRHYVGPAENTVIKELAVKRPGRIDRGKWYTARVEVRGPRVRCYLNGEKLFDLEHRAAAAGCVGLHTWYSPYRFRNIKVTRPDGTVLFDGLPDLSGR